MKKIPLLLFWLSVASSLAFGQLRVERLLTENLINPLGVESAFPRLSWIMISDLRRARQTAFELRVGSDPGQLAKGKALYWGSGKTLSAASVQVPYAGPALESGKRYYWQVRIWDDGGRPSAWSVPAFWQMALLHPSDWKASWIKAGYVEDSLLRPSPLLRKSFALSQPIRSATAFISARGMYEAEINGRRVGDAFLSPGWTTYGKRIPYQVYDVTSLLKTGANAIGVTLASGWYRGYIGFSGQNNFYGKEVSLLFQLEIRFADGSSATWVSDGTWKSSTGSIRSSEIYNGESIDDRDQKPGWTQAGYDDSGWFPVQVVPAPRASLVASANEPIREHERFKPQRIWVTPKGEQVMDFGQNLVGWVIVKVNGQKGQRISLTHAEVLDKEGNFYTENLRSAKAEDTYILSGEGEEEFKPHFTFHGFRYVRVEGYPGEIKPENFTAVALYSDMPVTGTFSCSNPLINQLQHNIQWGQRGNFLDVPTDCPQRDERLGWTGDAQVFSRTATFNMGVNSFFAKWLKDIALDQLPTGSVPFVVPNVLGPFGGSTGWADVATIVPWNTYLAYGDVKVLADQYPSMKAWVDYMIKSSQHYLWNTGFHFGDWLFYSPEDDNDGRAAVTNKYLIAQCFFAHSTQILIDAAKVLGKPEDARSYVAVLDSVKDAFQKEYLTPNGALVSGTQTAYVLALQFDMMPEALRKQAAVRLYNNVKSYEDHLTTGFLGTPYLCQVLTRFGYLAEAYRLLLQDTYPSWLYPVKMGATTIWERWDGIKPDSSFETPSMNSYNHYSYGAIGDWMYRVVAGLDTYDDAPGYRHSRIMPHPADALTQAQAALETYYGKLSVNWKTEPDRLDLDVEVPANTTCSLFIPGQDPATILESGKPLAEVHEVQLKRSSEGYVELEIGSGKYHFVRMNPVAKMP
jgi:alpha-L-rhamnosidase